MITWTKFHCRLETTTLCCMQEISITYRIPLQRWDAYSLHANWYYYFFFTERTAAAQSDSHSSIPCSSKLSIFSLEVLPWWDSFCKEIKMCGILWQLCVLQMVWIHHFLRKHRHFFLYGWNAFALVLVTAYCYHSISSEVLSKSLY